MCRFAIPKVQALKRQNTIIQYHHFALHTGFCEWQKIANFAANANVGMYKHISVAFNFLTSDYNHVKCKEIVLSDFCCTFVTQEVL